MARARSSPSPIEPEPISGIFHRASDLLRFHEDEEHIHRAAILDARDVGELLWETPDALTLRA